MRNSSLYAHEVQIVRAPGFEAGGFDIQDLCPGINIVYGPNAAGKTTLGRCIQVLLWPNDGESEILVGQFRLGEDEWRVELDHGRCDYQVNGQVTDPLELPPKDQRDRYWLSLDDLLQHETRNRSFAEAIIHEIAGGYDLSAAQEQLGFRYSPITKGKSVVSKTTQAIEDYEGVKQDIKDLKANQDRLPELYQDLDEIKQADETVKLLDQAITYAQARDDLREAREELDKFPGVLERLEGYEADHIHKIKNQTEEFIQERENALLQLHEASIQINEANLPKEGLPNGFINELKERRRDYLAAPESRKQDLEQQLEGAETRRDNALQEIPIQVDHETLEQLKPVAWGELAYFAERAEEIHAQRKLHNAIQGALKQSERPEPKIDTLKKAREILENWLRAPVPSADANRHWWQISLQILSGVIAGVGASMGALIHPALFALIAVAVVLLVFTYRENSSTKSVPDSRPAYQAEFAKLEIDPPSTWSVKDVQTRLKDIYQAVADHELEDRREHRLTMHLDELEDLKSKEQKLSDERSQLKERFGIAPHSNTEDIQLYMLAQSVSRWQRANDDVIDLQAQIEKTKGQIDSALDDFNKKVSAYNGEQAEDASEAERVIRDLEDRASSHKQGYESVGQADESIKTADSEIAKLVAECHSIVHKIGFDPEMLDQLTEICSQVEQFNQAKARVERTSELAEHEAQQLERQPQFEAELKVESVEELEDRKQNVKAIADQHDEKVRKIDRIETAIRNAKEQHSLEDALRNREHALDELANWLDSDYDAMVGQKLVNHLRENTTESTQPEVLQQASKVLSTFTRGRYQLDLDQNEATFRGYDTTSDRGFSLNELSSATRLQVLLAVRLAFITCQEDGPQLPLILDETLANTDDAKAEVIIDSMIELARDGRQIFYLTAQWDEVAKWRSALQNVSDVDQQVVNLSSTQIVSDTGQSLDAEDFSLPEVDFPDPEAHNHASYGQALGVPPLDPWQPSGSVHVWYLTDDPRLIHRLVSRSIQRWGQVKETLDRGNREFLSSDPETVAQLERQGKALAEFIHLSRIGRDKPIDRDVLEASGAISERFIDRVTNLARELNGRPRQLLDGLRDGQIEHFRHDKIDELEAYLANNGYLVDEEPISTDDIRRRMIEALHQEGSLEEVTIREVDALLSRIHRLEL